MEMRDIKMTQERFYEIYQKYYRLVTKVAYTIVGDYDTAQDVCQEVYMLFLKKADELEEKYYKVWFVTNAKRKAIDHNRSSNNRHERTVKVEDGDSEETPEEVLDRVRSEDSYCEDNMANRYAQKEFVKRILDELQKNHRDWYEIVIRMFMNGETSQATAAALGITEVNLRAKRHRLKVWMEKNYYDEYKELM